MDNITPCLWFDSRAEEAVRFYASIFKDSSVGHISRYGESGAIASGMPKGAVLTVSFQLYGQDFIALNGGPAFKFSPAISFFVYCRTEKEINSLFERLSDGGEVRMALDKYPFSERYAFISDKFGVSWQLILADSAQKIVPCLLFVGKQVGNAEAAVRFYTKIFKKSAIRHIQKYGVGEKMPKGSVKHALFSLEGQDFTAMSGGGIHKFTFTEATSFIVNCSTQEEIDYFWEKLSKGGAKVQCGWLKDKYGISWQVVPTVLGKMIQSKDASKTEKVMEALMEMRKIDVKILKQAYEEG